MSDLTIVTPRSWWDLADACQFYPSDLPEDWRLAYFANAFGAVLLPYATWVNAEAATLAQWREDVTPRFRFVAEAGRAPQAADQAMKLERALGAQLTDWLSPDMLPPPARSPSPGSAPGSVPSTPCDVLPAEAEPDRPVCAACWPAGAQAGADRLGTANGTGWACQSRPEHEAWTDEYAVQVPAALHQDLRAARRWLNGLIAERRRAPAVILLAHPSSETLEAWHRLVELLGLMRDSGRAQRWA